MSSTDRAARPADLGGVANALAALAHVEAELRRLRKQFAAVLAMVERDVPAVIAREAQVRRDLATALEHLGSRDGVIAEQVSTIRLLNLALARERGRRLAPKRGQEAGRRA